VLGRILGVQVALGFVVAEGDGVVDAEEEEVGGEAVDLLAEGPELALVVDAELEVVDEVDVQAAAVVVDDGVVADVAGGGGVEVDGAAAGEDVDVGVVVGEEGFFGLEAEEVGALFDVGAVGEIDAGFDGGLEGKFEVAGGVEAEADAVVVVRAVGGVDELVAGKGGEVEGFGGGRDVLRAAAGCDGEQGEDTDKPKKYRGTGAERFHGISNVGRRGEAASGCQVRNGLMAIVFHRWPGVPGETIGLD
jgi:hypothetical protein